MLKGWLVALAAIVFAISPAGARGGYVYIPVFVPGGPIAVPAPKVGDVSHIQKVAIISALGQTMMLGRAGWLADHSTVDVSDMNLDNFVEDALHKYLSERYAIVNVPYDRAKLAAIPNGTLDFTSKEVTDYLATLPADGVDAFVVVRPDGEGGGANTPGLSLAIADGGDKSPSIISANFEIDIVDAHTHTIISHALSRIQPRQGEGAHFAAMVGPSELKIEPGQTPTPDQRSKLRVQYVKLLSNSLIETLRVLNLNIALPRPGERVMIPIPEEKRPKAKTIAFISLIGDTLTLDHRGAFFVHDTAEEPIPGWNLDSEIEAKMTDALDKRIVQKPSGADRAKILSQKIAYTSKEVYSTPIEGLPDAPDVDIYVMVLKGPDGSGVMMQHFTPIGSANTSVSLRCVFLIADGKTHKPIYMHYIVASPAMPVQMPVGHVDNADWPEKPPLSPEQSQAVHKIVDDLLDDSVPETMMRLGLTGMMPSGELPPAPTQPAAQNAP